MSAEFVAHMEDVLDLYTEPYDPQLLPTPDRPRYAGIRVEVEERMDGSLVVCYQGRDIPTQEAPPSLTAPQTPPVIRQIPLR